MFHSPSPIHKDAKLDSIYAKRLSESYHMGDVQATVTHCHYTKSQIYTLIEVCTSSKVKCTDHFTVASEPSQFIVSLYSSLTQILSKSND